MFNPDELEDLIRTANERHAAEMNVLRQAAEIARRLKSGVVASDAAPRVTQALSPSAKPPTSPVRNRKGQPANAGLTEKVRELYRKLDEDFTIRTIADALESIGSYVGTAHLLAGISAILTRDAQAGKIVLVKQGSAGIPSVYRNKATASGGQLSFNGNGAHAAPATTRA